MQNSLLRTSSFRLTLLYAALSGLGFLVLFGVVLWSTTSYMDRQIDGTVATELTEVQADAAGGIERLRGIVQDLSGRSPGYFYLLQDAQGTVLAGNMPGLQPLPGVRQWSDQERSPPGGVRGRGTLLPGGAYLFIGTDTHQLHEMREMVVRSFLSGLGAVMVLALIGGALMSMALLRRIETVSQTSRDIIGGDLSRRIPVSGSGDEFDHLATSLNTMLDRIQALMENLRQVSTDIAHDLRTPLTRLRQRLELAQRDFGDSRAVEAVFGATLHDLDGILETFGALLRIAQIESGARKAGFTEVDLGELLRTVIEIYQTALEDRNQTLRQDIGSSLPVKGDRELLTQLFANLLENASRHSPAGSDISLTARRLGAQVEVIVADNGPGIPAPLRGKVVQRFYRLESSRTTPGNGLGLSLAAAVADLHGAPLELGDNQPGLRVRACLTASGY